jgi:hypothetical protein
MPVGRREPSAAAKTLIKIAEIYPRGLKKSGAIIASSAPTDSPSGTARPQRRDSEGLAAVDEEEPKDRSLRSPTLHI